MEDNIYIQFHNLFIFIIIGFVIGILFDFFRSIRKTFKTPDFITYIEDIIFWILVGIILIFSIFIFNNGEIRSYIFIGLIFGIGIYVITISKYFLKIIVTIFSFLKQILYFPFIVIGKIVRNFIIKPFSIIFNKLKQKLSSKGTNNISNDIINDNFPKI